MNKLTQIISFIALAGFLAMATIQFIGKEKTVYIDTNVIMQKYLGMKDAQAEYGEKAKVWEANVDTLMSEWQSELQNYEKERSSMTKREKELKEELLRNKQQQIGNYRQAMQQKTQEEEQKITQTVVNEINDFMEEYGEEHNYKYILGATGMGNIVYAREKMDITDKVLKLLNEEYRLNRGITDKDEKVKKDTLN